jgi:pyruvate/2-oxoglutarate dehydrogenase complex dihydrolipoamide acyltransferase (E2) component
MTITPATTIRLLAAATAAAGLAALTGCSASPHDATARPAPTVTVTATASARPVVTRSTAPASAPPASTAPASPSAPASPAAAASTPAPPASAAVPVLGRLAGVFAHGSGFGSVRPARVFNGGDPTGLVSGITWASWGAASATGAGTSEWVGPGQSVASGRAEPVTIVAFDLGPCDGVPMYRAVEWYFPQHGQSFSPARYEDVCTGSYAGTP